MGNSKGEEIGILILYLLENDPSLFFFACISKNRSVTLEMSPVWHESPRSANYRVNYM